MHLFKDTSYNMKFLHREADNSTGVREDQLAMNFLFAY